MTPEQEARIRGYIVTLKMLGHARHECGVQVWLDAMLRAPHMKFQPDYWERNFEVVDRWVQEAKRDAP